MLPSLVTGHACGRVSNANATLNAMQPASLPSLFLERVRVPRAVQLEGTSTEARRRQRKLLQSPPCHVYSSGDSSLQNPEERQVGHDVSVR